MDLDNEMYPSKKTHIVYLKADKVLVQVPSKYADFADVFLFKLAIELPKHTEINDYAVKLVNNQQPLFGLIYSLDLVKLKMLKTYI